MVVPYKCFENSIQLQIVKLMSLMDFLHEANYGHLVDRFINIPNKH